jgi:LPXTG-motif cell wall-anchored protein
MNGGTFYMSGGTIDNNYARDIVSYRNRMENYHKNAGGGVYLNTGSHMYLSGGTISNNQSSREGGGISLGWLNRSNGSAVSEYNTYLTMTGGTITENFAVSTGGGINITAGCEATISAGYITNNTAQGREYQDSDEYVNAGTYCEVFTGGGIYLDAQQTDSRGNYAGVPGKCTIHRVIITDNTADYGGGIASCATSDTTLGTDVDIGDGTAIYGNTSDNNDQLYIYQGQANIGNTVLGGGNYNWTKSGSYYKNSLTDSSSAIVTAKELATVYITGNTGYLGGGIGCNGIVFVGTTDEEDDVTSISIEKKWVDTVTTHRPEYITVQLYQNGKAYGDPIRIYPTVNDNCEEIWPVYYIDDLPDGYTYTISEVSVPGYTSSVTSSNRRYTITNKLSGFTVEKVWLNDEEADRPGGITVQLYQNGVAYGEVETLNKANSWSYIWMDLPEVDGSGNKYSYTAKEINVPNGYICTEPGKLSSDGVWVIENSKIPDTSVSAMKKWADGTAGTDNVTIQLLANGEAYGNPVKLNAENSWFYMWENLPTLTAGGETITYTVKEERVHGYISEIKVGTDAPTHTEWTEVTSLTANETYMFVSSDGALATKGTDQLVWSNVTSNLADGTTPSDSALWTYTSSRYLRNGNGRYLYLRYTNRTYTFYTATSGQAITYTSSKNLQGRYSSTSRYFGSINTSGYGTATTSSGSATDFTVYKMTEVKTEIGETHYVITNTKRNDSLTIWFTKYIAKEDETDSFPVLPGAELALYRWVEGEELIPGTSYSGVLVDQWTSESAISTNGGAYGVDLTNGIYYLIETKAPSGYAAPFEPIIFEVDADKGEINIIQYPVYEEFLPSFSEDGVISGSDSINIPVYNSLVYELPETGGSGTYYYTSGGLLLIMSAIILLLYKKRHGKEERKFS